VTTTADKRRATRLMKDARIMALALIDEDVYAARHIAYLTVPFVLEAARVTPRDYAAAEVERVLAGVRDRVARFAAAGGD